MNQPLFVITFFLRKLLSILVSFMIIFALYFFLRGHNAPGGGFIGGVVFSIGITLVYIVLGDTYMKLLQFKPIQLSAWGMALAFLTALFPLFLGDPFLTHYMVYVPAPLLGKLHIGTPFFFDLGIMMCVSGMIIQTIVSLSKQIISSSEGEDA